MDQDPKSEGDSDAENKPRTAKRPKKAAATTASAKKKRAGMSSDPDEIAVDDMVTMDKWSNVEDWDELIESVDTMERDDNDDLFVFFTL